MTKRKFQSVPCIWNGVMTYKLQEWVFDIADADFPMSGWEDCHDEYDNNLITTAKYNLDQVVAHLTSPAREMSDVKA